MKTGHIHPAIVLTSGAHDLETKGQNFNVVGQLR